MTPPNLNIQPPKTIRFCLPQITAHEADVIFHFIAVLQDAFWEAYESPLVDIAISQLNEVPPDDCHEQLDHDIPF
jgi:hypothetical protein